MFVFITVYVFSELIFVDILDDNFNQGVRGIHRKRQFSIVGELPWSIKENKDFTINLLDKEISDFSLDLKKEIYKDKLIIVCDIEGVFQLLHLITDLNLINQFQIQLKNIQSLPEEMSLFQIIIY